MRDNHSNKVKTLGRAVQTSGRKSRVTFSLSGATVQFLQKVKEDRKLPSLSASVENMVGDLRRERELAALNDSMTDYYNNLSDPERSDDAAWGQVGLQGLTALEKEEKEIHRKVRKS